MKFSNEFPLIESYCEHFIYVLIFLLPYCR
jgi:hypothetical protein